MDSVAARLQPLLGDRYRLTRELPGGGVGRGGAVRWTSVDHYAVMPNRALVSRCVSAHSE